MVIRNELGEDPAPRIDGSALSEALANESARRILAVCMDDPCSVKQISQRAGIPLATTYRRVRDLEGMGLVTRERSAISPEGNRYDLYRSPLSEAAIRISPEGIDILWDDPQG